MTSESRSGELVTTLAIASLIVMVVGSIFGSKITQNPLNTRSQALGVRSGCGGSCTNNSSCQRTETIGAYKVGLQCDMRKGICVPSNDDLFSEAKRANPTYCPGYTARNDPWLKGPGEGPCNYVTDCRSGLKCMSCGGVNKICVENSQCPAPTRSSRINLPTVSPRFGSATTAPTGRVGGIPGVGGVNPTSSVINPTIDPHEGEYQQCGVFKRQRYNCAGGFQLSHDPEVISIRIIDGTNSYSFGQADLVNSSTGRTSPVGFIIRGATANYTDNLQIDWHPTKSNPAGSPPDPVVWIKIVSDCEGVVGNCAYEEATFYYKKASNGGKAPNWIWNSNPKTIEFRYHPDAWAGSKNKWCEQRIENLTVSDCVLETATGTPTPTVTIPTRTPTVTIPTRTPTVTIPTRTPTVTIPTVTIPTSTPPITCDEEVHFLIDASNTIIGEFGGIKSKISEEIIKYFTDYPQDVGKLKFTYQYFTYKVHGLNSLNGPLYTFSDYNGPPYTNIKQALLTGIRKNTIFISDGIPSVVEGMNSGNILCGFVKSGCMSNSNLSQCTNGRKNTFYDECIDGGKPVGKSVCKSGCENYTYEDAYNATLRSANKQARYGYLVIKAENIEEIVSAASRTMKRDLSNLPNQLRDIIDDTCQKPNRVGSIPAGTRGGVSVSYNVSNESSGFEIVSVKTTACQKNDTLNCSSQTSNLPIKVGSTGKNKVDLTLPKNVSSNESVNVTCDFKYANGSTKSCPEKTTTNGDTVTYTLTAKSDSINGLAESQIQLSDFNGDGYVNTLDYVVCIRQMVQDNKPNSMQTLDTGTCVSAQDLSAVVKYLGKTTSIAE